MQALTEKAVAVSSARMGRPKLNVKGTTVRLPETVIARIEALCGKNQMAAFIREAVLAELERREKAKG